MLERSPLCRASASGSNCCSQIFPRGFEPLALERLLNHGINDGKIARQFLWEIVANFQVGGTGRTHPCPIIRTLPDEHFEGQIKCEQWGSNHEWRATFRIAKDQHMSLLHREADSSRLSTMVNVGKEGQIATVYDLLEAFQRLFRRKRTRSGHNSLDQGRRSRLCLLVHHKWQGDPGIHAWGGIARC